VAIVVMSYVFFGGNARHGLGERVSDGPFLCFGAVAFALIARSLGGFDQVMQGLGIIRAPDRCSAGNGFPPKSF
jgi:hypothetical protein